LSGLKGNLVDRLWQSPTLMTSGSIGVRLLGLGAMLPLALNRLPVDEANLWFLFSSLLAIITLIDFGFSPTFTRFVAYCRTEQEVGQSKAMPIRNLAATTMAAGPVIATMRHIYNGVGIVAFVVAATAGSIAVAGPIGQLDEPQGGWAAWAVIAVVGSIGLRSGMYSTYLQGVEQIALYRRWEILIGIISASVGCVILIAGGGLLEIVVSTQIGVLVNAWVNRKLAISVSSPQEWSDRPIVDRDIMDAVWPAAWRSGIGVLMSAGVIQGTGVMYAQLSTPEESAPYLLALRLIQSIRTFSNVPFYTRLPSLARKYAEGRLDRIVDIARVGMNRTNWMLLAGVVAVGFFGEALIELIRSKTPFVAPAIWGMLGLAILVERVGAMHLQLYSTTNHVVWHIANGVSGIIMLTAIPFAYARFGVLGFPLGILIGYVTFYAPYSIRLSYRAFKLRITDMDLSASIFPIMLLLVLEIALLLE